MNAPFLKDADLIVTRALPNGAATVSSAAIDLGAGRKYLQPSIQFMIVAPALVVGDLGNGETMTYVIQTDNDAAFGSPTTRETVITQTGAGGVGAAAQTAYWKPDTECERYVRVAITNSAAGDASDKTATFQLVF